MKKINKTNAMRILEKNNVLYEVFTYSVEDLKIDGISVANKISKPCEMVYKTLVTKGKSNEHYVFVVPVEYDLDLKKAAKTAKEKSIEMIAVKELFSVTGYIRGGCSPLGMKKSFKTFIEESASLLDYIVVSGGKIGIQLQISIDDFVKVSKVEYSDLIK